MTTPFSESEVIKRTARRLMTNETRVRNFLDAFTEEWIKHARETEPELIRTGIVAPPVPPVAPEATAKPAKKATTPRKSRAKGTTPAKGSEGSQGITEGNALAESLMQDEARASVALDGETQVIG